MQILNGLNPAHFERLVPFGIHLEADGHAPRKWTPGTILGTLAALFLGSVIDSSTLVVLDTVMFSVVSAQYGACCC